MALKGLNDFTYLAMDEFIEDKQLVFVKASSWQEGEGKGKAIVGSKILIQILEDSTTYKKEGVNNFGEQFTVKVRNVAPSAYQKFKPLQTQVTVTDVEKATVWGDYRNQISVIATVKPVEVSKNDAKTE